VRRKKLLSASEQLLNGRFWREAVSRDIHRPNAKKANALQKLVLIIDVNFAHSDNRRGQTLSLRVQTRLATIRPVGATALAGAIGEMEKPRIPA
jgi:hypothetical protein